MCDGTNLSRFGAEVLRSTKGHGSFDWEGVQGLIMPPVPGRMRSSFIQF